MADNIEKWVKVATPVVLALLAASQVVLHTTISGKADQIEADRLVADLERIVECAVPQDTPTTE